MVSYWRRSTGKERPTRRKLGNLIGEEDAYRLEEDFKALCLAASRHLRCQPQSMLTKSIRPPVFEHFQFIVGNQLFFVRVEDIDDGLYVPGSLAAIQELAEECRGHACVLPMRWDGDQWLPVGRGWGLFDPRTGNPVDPMSLITDEYIELTDWELQELAVQAARGHLIASGREVIPWNAHPGSDPSLWIGPENAPEWVVVRAVRYPIVAAEFPKDWDEIAAACAHRSSVGHCLSVAITSTGDPVDFARGGAVVPLWRNCPVFAVFTWLKPDDTLQFIWDRVAAIRGANRTAGSGFANRAAAAIRRLLKL